MEQGLEMGGLGRRRQSADRLPLSCGQSRGHAKIRGRTRRSGADVIVSERHSVLGTPAAGKSHRAYCVCQCRRPSGRWLCRQSGSTGWKRHWIFAVRIQPQREMGGTAQGDRIVRECVVVLRDPTVTSGIGQFAVVQSVAPGGNGGCSDQRALPCRNRTPLRGFRELCEWRGDRNRERAGSSPSRFAVALAARHRLPRSIIGKSSSPLAASSLRGWNLIDQFGHAGGCAGRILNGEKPADLPVQAPTKYELIVNLKTAKALRLQAPSPLLARADEVIE